MAGKKPNKLSRKIQTTRISANFKVTKKISTSSKPGSRPAFNLRKHLNASRNDDNSNINNSTTFRHSHRSDYDPYNEDIVFPGDVPRFLNHEKLPASAPLEHPHILASPAEVGTTINLQDLRLCDGIATVLWNFDKEAFDTFFDEDVRFFEFEVTRETVVGPRGEVHKVVYAIQRDGRNVFVSPCS